MWRPEDWPQPSRRGSAAPEPSLSPADLSVSTDFHRLTQFPQFSTLFSVENDAGTGKGLLCSLKMLNHDGSVRRPDDGFHRNRTVRVNFGVSVEIIYSAVLGHIMEACGSVWDSVEESDQSAVFFRI